MPNIECSQTVVDRRSQDILKFLRPIKDKKSWLTADKMGLTTSSMVIAARDSSLSRGRNFREWFFKTIVQNYQGQYFEIWEQSPAKRTMWCLQRSYFHLFRFDPSAQKSIEILALHCDPNESSRELRVNYKRVPHLHIREAQEPICKAHFALDGGGYLAKNLASTTIDSLTSAIAWAIQMLKVEVFDAANKP